MNKKDFFQETTSADLDARITASVDSILELKAKNNQTQGRRNFFVWSSLAAAASAYILWLNTKQDPTESMQLSLAEDLNDEVFVALEEFNLDVDDEMLDNIDIIEEWRDGDEQS